MSAEDAVKCSYWYTSMLVEEGIQCGGAVTHEVDGKPFCAKHPYLDRKEIGPDPDWVAEHFSRLPSDSARGTVRQ